MTSSLRPTDPPTFVIRNLGHGQVIQVEVDPPVSAANVQALEHELRRLVERRQPRELRVVLPEDTERPADELFGELRRTLEEVGGTLTVTSAAA